MDAQGSVSRWLVPLQTGESVAVEILWKRYFPRLVLLARRRLGQALHGAADEEDVALSAFDSFCRRAERGQFPKLHDRDGLWRLLVEITLCKVSDLIRHEMRRKRGGGMTRHPNDEQGENPFLSQLISREPTPEFAAEIAEECCRLLDVLGNPTLKQVAVWRMEGYAFSEIAQRLRCSVRSVDRKLSVIREIWQEQRQR